MRKWSKQGFLNPADSNDDGWYKFSIRPKKTNRVIGMSIQYIISDCSNKIYLEFAPDYVSLDDDGGVKELEDYTGALATVKARRKKNKDFVAAVVKAGEMIDKNLDEFEEELNRALDITQARE